MKDLLKLFGYTALVIVVGGAASIGGEVLTGTTWGGWMAGAVALCGIVAIMFKLEKNGLCAVESCREPACPKVGVPPVPKGRA